MVRIITMCLLTVTDVDVALTSLFLWNVNTKRQANPGDIMYTVTLGLVALGFVVYFAGILFIAPNQKYKVMSIVKDLMRTGKSDFVTQKWRTLRDGTIIDSSHGQFEEGEAVKVTLAMPIYPQQEGQRSNEQGVPRKFDKLEEKNQNHQQAFKAGLEAWGVGPVWDAVEVENAKNCCETKHGLPFYRTASFGFMSQPGPKDLGGIFNANALFSFSVGTFELVFGYLMCREDGWELQTVLPLSVSSVSFILSLANVIFDFSCVLMEIEAEARMASAIKNRIDAAMEAQKARLLRTKDRKSAEINRRAGDGPGELVMKTSELDAVAREYQLMLDQLNQQILDELETEITSWQTKLKKERALLRGKSLIPEDGNRHEGNLLDNAKADKKLMEAKVQEIRESSRSNIQKLKVEEENFAAQIDEICNKRQEKVTSTKAAMSPLLKNCV